MFTLFAGITGLFSLLFLRHYYPYFKDANDFFSIADFIIIYGVTTALIAIIVFTPYYLLMT